MYVISGLTPARASSMHMDRAFDGRVDGHVYAQPLVFNKAGRELLLVATENNVVDALDARTGSPIWKKSLGQAVTSAMLPCGNIDPLGITGTPVIDEPRDAIYLDAMVLTQDGPQHLVFGLSLDKGQPLAGFPVNVARALAANGMHFIPREQNQRGALLIVKNTVYIPYGGHFGDCGHYHGWVVGISLDDAHRVTAWSTRAVGGGIWAPAGIVSDGHSLFVATGNTFGADSVVAGLWSRLSRIRGVPRYGRDADWGGGEAVIRYDPELKPPASGRDYFAPRDWQTLDDRDADLGGTNPILLNVGRSHLVLALGKDAKAYLLDRDNLGGIGGALAIQEVSGESIITAPATYPAPNGDAFVALHSLGSNCPAPISDPSLIVLRIQAQPAPAISTAWCGSLEGAGAPIVTTTDGHSNPIVWIVGAEGDNRLHAFRGDNGEPILGSQPRMQGLRHFATIVITQDRLFVPGDGRIYAFTP